MNWVNKGKQAPRVRLVSKVDGLQTANPVVEVMLEASALKDRKELKANLVP